MNYLELERTLARHIHLRQQAELQGAALTRELRLSMGAAPAYRVNADGTAEISCDTFTCHIFYRDGKALCQLEMCRAEAKADTATPTLLKHLRWYPIQAMEPWPYGEGKDPLAALESYPDLPCAEGGGTGDLLAIRNLQNLFFEHRLHDLEPLFSQSAQASLEIEELGVSGSVPEALDQCKAVLDRERENAHCYLFLGVTGMPVIEVSPDGGHAHGLFMTQLYQVRGAAYGKDPADWTLHRWFALTRSEYVKEGGVWKILRMQIRKLVDLPDVPYSITGRYDRSGQSSLPWEVAQTCGTPPDADAAMEIENIIQSWAYGCRQGTLPAFVDSHMKNPQGRNRMWIKSFGEGTPVQDDLSKIVAKITDMTSQYREGYYTFHAPTTPVIQTLSGHCVLATWFDCAATNLRSMAKSPEAVPYMAFVNKYTHRFEKMDGKWYLTEFKNEPMIALPDWELNMTDNIGWLANSRIRRFPDTFGEESQLPVTTVFPSPESPTGYAVRFCYFAPEREQVWVLGDWMFSDAAHSTVTDSARIWPHEWREGVFPHTLMGLKSTPKELKEQVPGEEIDVSKFEFDWDILKLGLYEMEKDAQGVFSRTIPLPSGVFNYRFVLDIPDGNPLRMVCVPDPAFPPKVAEGETGVLSQVCVPFDAAYQTEDRSIELPYRPEDQGSVRYFRYPTDPAFGLGAEQTCAVYLPKGYSGIREKLPVLYLSHGGTDGLSAWINQGAMPAILDHLVAEGRIPPMAVILMDNEAFHWNDREKCIPNLTDHLMPWAEQTFRIADEAQSRAFAGLSAGGMLAFEVLEAAGDQFAAVGIWSGGQRFDADFDKPSLRHPKIHIGAGEYDDAHFAFSRPLAEKLAAYGISSRECYPLGGHQWSVWRKLLEDFLTEVFLGTPKENEL